MQEHSITQIELIRDEEPEGKNLENEEKKDVATVAIEIARDDLQKEAEASWEARKKASDEARAANPSKFPKGMNRAKAIMLINTIDFLKADYVETVKTTNMVTRRAFVHYRQGEYDCWIGANAHPPSGSGQRWRPGNTYILEYHGFEMPTSEKAVHEISQLPAEYGDKPAILT